MAAQGGTERIRDLAIVPNRAAFWLVAGLMSASTALIFWYFRRKNWW